VEEEEEEEEASHDPAHQHQQQPPQEEEEEETNHDPAHQQPPRKEEEVDEEEPNRFACTGAAGCVCGDCATGALREEMQREATEFLQDKRLWKEDAIGRRLELDDNKPQRTRGDRRRAIKRPDNVARLVSGDARQYVYGTESSSLHPHRPWMTSKG
jgi:hypothetical protein